MTIFRTNPSYFSPSPFLVCLSTYLRPTLSISLPLFTNSWIYCTQITGNQSNPLNYRSLLSIASEIVSSYLNSISNLFTLVVSWLSSHWFRASSIYCVSLSILYSFFLFQFSCNSSNVWASSMPSLISNTRMVNSVSSHFSFYWIISISLSLIWG